MCVSTGEANTHLLKCLFKQRSQNATCFHLSVSAQHRPLLSPLCRYRALTFILTFLLYTSFHLSRKPISIVKVTHTCRMSTPSGQSRYCRLSCASSEAAEKTSVDSTGYWIH